MGPSDAASPSLMPQMGKISKSRTVAACSTAFIIVEGLNFFEMSWFLTFGPAYVVLPIAFIVPMILLVLSAKGRNVSWLAWIVLGLAASLEVTAGYARALSLANDSQAKVWWLITGVDAALPILFFMGLLAFGYIRRITRTHTQ